MSSSRNPLDDEGQHHCSGGAPQMPRLCSSSRRRLSHSSFSRAAIPRSSPLLKERVCACVDSLSPSSVLLRRRSLHSEFRAHACGEKTVFRAVSSAATTPRPSRTSSPHVMARWQPPFLPSVLFFTSRKPGCVFLRRGSRRRLALRRESSRTCTPGAG